MFKGNSNFVVGLFVTASLAALVAFSLWLAGRTGGEPMVNYSMLFERDVSGLVIGGPVKFMGVNVGSVLRMELDQQGEVAVRVDIEVLESTPVDADTYASLAFQGITGLAVINLEHVHGDHQPITRTPGYDHPLIKVRDSGFAALLQDIPKISGKLNDLLDRVGYLLAEENLNAITDTLVNIEALTQTLADERETIAAIPGDLRATIKDVRGTVGDLSTLLDEARPDIQVALGNVRSATARLDDLMQRIDLIVANNQDGIDRFISEGLGQAPALITELRRTLREVKKLVQELQDDPSILIHRPEENSLEVDP